MTHDTPTGPMLSVDAPNADVLSVGAAFVQALGAVQTAGLPMIALRPKAISADTAAAEGDFDFLVDPAALLEILRIFTTACLGHGVDLEYRQDFATKKVLIIASPQARVMVELWPRIEMGAPGGGMAILDPAPLLARHHAGDATAVGTLLAAIYITHLAYKKKDLDGALQQARLRHFHDLVQAAAPGSSLSGVFAGLLQGQPLQASATDAALAVLRQHGMVPVPQTLVRRITRRARRWMAGLWRLPARVIPVLGPDGSGKTYVCEHIVAQSRNGARPPLVHKPFKRFFRSGPDYRLIQKVMARRHPGQPQNVIDEKMPVYVLAKATLGVLVYARLMAWRGKRAIIDRYHWDYLLANLRNDAAPPARIRGFGLLRHVAPRPEKLVIVLCSTATILSRKQELSADRIDFVYDAYLRNVAEGYCGRAFFYNSEKPFHPGGAVVAGFIAEKS